MGHALAELKLFTWICPALDCQSGQTIATRHVHINCHLMSLITAVFLMKR